ncbi:ribosome maturation factor RimM [Numidum massiliense]|uniref:ribosome maturation factor RimM n=1 Tax=Numidum massiliense TaxID=1522315 RepID=UPI0006D5632B|nr:ribosome maturation factor RimM [Numidum massiliense]
MSAPEWLTVGYISKPQGLAGEVRVKVATDFPEQRFASGEALFVFPKGELKPLQVTVAHSRSHKGQYVVKFREFETVDEVEQLRGGEIKIAAAAAHALDEHEYYFYEIVGCEVVTTDGERVGTITDILQPGANDVWVVKRQGAKAGELYLPYIADVVKQVLPEQKKVVIEWMPGLE